MTRPGFVKKGPLKPSLSPLTSNSYVETPASRGELQPGLDRGKREGTSLTRCLREEEKTELTEIQVIQFNPLLTPSPLLDPKVRERRLKEVAQR